MKTYLVSLNLKSCFLALLVTVLLGGPAGSFVARVQSADQVEPSAEHKRLSLLVGRWNYEGQGPQTPFWPAGRFVGVSTTRWILNGLFAETRWQDTNSQSGYVASGVTIQGYDASKKVYVVHGFENDGSASVGTATSQRLTWTTLGTRTGPDGKLYHTKNEVVYSADGKSLTEKYQYSSDNGKSWSIAYESKAKKVGE